MTTTTAEPVALTLTATSGGARVVVRDGNDRLVFSGDLAYGQSHALRAAPPIKVQSTDGAVQVTFSTTFEIEGVEKPAAVVESIARFFA